MEQAKTQLILDDYHKKMRESVDEIFEFALRNIAQPPIKGEITKGKVKWRGIRIIQQSDIDFYGTWLEQRGKRISQVIQINSFIK